MAVAVHKRVRQAGRVALAHVRRAGHALQGRRAGARDDGDPEAGALDERLSALAAHVAAGNFFESPWQLVRFGQLKGLSDEEAVPMLAAWCKRHGLAMSFVERQIGHVDVVCVVVKRRAT